jgi:hypothetical protein
MKKLKTITTYAYSITTRKGLVKYSNKYPTILEAKKWLKKYRDKLGFTMRGEMELIKYTEILK